MMETTSFDIFYSGYRVVLYYSLNKVPLQVVSSELSVPLKKYQGYDRFHMSILLCFPTIWSNMTSPYPQKLPIEFVYFRNFLIYLNITTKIPCRMEKMVWSTKNSNGLQKRKCKVIWSSHSSRHNLNGIQDSGHGSEVNEPINVQESMHKNVCTTWVLKWFKCV